MTVTMSHSGCHWCPGTFLECWEIYVNKCIHVATYVTGRSGFQDLFYFLWVKVNLLSEMLVPL